MIIKIGWGTKIAILYCGFITLIVTLVVGSCRQHFDLVSANYYNDEVAYQKVIDAQKNDQQLSAPITIASDRSSIAIGFPDEFKGQELKGKITFYSPVNAAWDRSFPISTDASKMHIDISKLALTRYTVKIELTAGNKDYYQESEMNLYR